MIDTDELRGLMAKSNISGVEMAKMLGICPKTFYSKMKNQVFGSQEIELIIDILDINRSRVADIFFAKGSIVRRHKASNIEEEE